MCLHIHVCAHVCAHTHTHTNQIAIKMRHFPDKSCSIDYIVGKCVLKAYCGTFAVAEDVSGQEVLRWGPMSRCKHTGPEQAMLKAAV